MRCEYCDADAIYKCALCGRLLCGEHVRLRTVCHSSSKKTEIDYSIQEAPSKEDTMQIRELVKRFWGEQEQLTFDREFKVAELPAYVAKADGGLVGFVSFTEVSDAMLVVALGVLPQYQFSGVGKSLIEKVENEAKRTHKSRLFVSTSNDDLPALAFYQSIGFQIFEVKPNIIAEKHGRILQGIGGLPIRDELRLQKTLNKPSCFAR
jgi:N-acetylglutamate synthase-like GNAT family acetyltransferase